jgi:hypothetical protein
VLSPSPRAIHSLRPWPRPPHHVHENCSEQFYVLEGEPEIITETGRQRLGVGESLIVPPNKPHTFENATEADARVISVYSPPGFERYFLDMGVLVDAPNAREARKTRRSSSASNPKRHAMGCIFSRRRIKPRNSGG